MYLPGLQAGVGDPVGEGVGIALGLGVGVAVGIAVHFSAPAAPAVHSPTGHAVQAAQSSLLWYLPVVQWLHISCTE
jgi:hypothetical protein